MAEAVPSDSKPALPVAGENIVYQAIALPGGGGELIASGNAPTAGFTFFFHDLLPKSGGGNLGIIGTTRFEFLMVRPTDNVVQIVTPFRVTKSVTTLLSGSTITIIDGLGEHTIRVTATEDPAARRY